MDNELELRRLERGLLDVQVARMLLAYNLEELEAIRTGREVDVDAHARKIVAFLREHLVK